MKKLLIGSLFLVGCAGNEKLYHIKCVSDGEVIFEATQDRMWDRKTFLLHDTATGEDIKLNDCEIERLK